MKIAIVTGGNAGIGLALCERLLTYFERECPMDFTLCLACRNKTRAEAAKENLHASHPSANVDILLVDMCDLETVYKASAEIKKRYEHIDYIFLNAGIMGKTSLDLRTLFKKILSPEVFAVLSTGHGVLRQEDEKTRDGLQAIFSTNLFAHFVLVRRLLDLGVVGGPQLTQIIWNSSTNATSKNFSLSDIQHVQGCEPYSSSKYATDQISYIFNHLYNTQNLFSHLTSPGTVVTNITTNIIPSWCWTLLTPVFYLLRPVLPSLTYSPHNGAEAMMWVMQQPPTSLDPAAKFLSQTTLFGVNYVAVEKADIDTELAQELFERLCTLDTQLTPDWLHQQ